MESGLNVQSLSNVPNCQDARSASLTGPAVTLKHSLGIKPNRYRLSAEKQQKILSKKAKVKAVKTYLVAAALGRVARRSLVLLAILAYRDFDFGHSLGAA
jgi:hypothetical protein